MWGRLDLFFKTKTRCGRECLLRINHKQRDWKHMREIVCNQPSRSGCNRPGELRIHRAKYQCLEPNKKLPVHINCFNDILFWLADIQMLHCLFLSAYLCEDFTKSLFLLFIISWQKKSIMHQGLGNLKL